MKNLHFYIQSVMLILALSIAVQIPFNKDMFACILAIEFFLGAYQLVMSTLLNAKLSFRPILLRVHFYGSWVYIISLIIIGMSSTSWMTSGYWNLTLFIIPWAFAILFLVAMDEMERFRHYRL